ncbi:uncharacterized protein LOC125869685 [Solanum stenotomum]|uniref:uncharacterized protein LOC125869685 n=1 Tax=Solanum stenotomum TaxID=172797 RepID=UPI0020D1DEAA|nr:uncharacterized protein LOC125869685 [Solanum stenotomum]
MSKFLFGVSDLVKTECKNAMLLEDVNISKLMTHAQQVEEDMLREMAKDNKKDQKGRASGSKFQGSASSKRTFQTYPKCGKNHPDECLARTEGCFGYGQSGHRLKDCPSARQGQGSNNNKAQSIAPTTPAGRPTQ